MIAPLMNMIRSELLERMGTELSEKQRHMVAGYIGISNRKTAMTIGKVSQECGLNYELATKVLSMLADIGTLRREQGIICPQCSFMLGKISVADIVEPIRLKICCRSCGSKIYADASNVDTCYTLSDESIDGANLPKVDRLSLRIEFEKQKIANLSELCGKLNDEISTAEQNLPQLKREYEEALENFILEYMCEKFGIENLHDGNRSYLIFDKAAQFIKIYRLKQDFEYMDGKDGMTAALKNEKLYGHCAASWFSRGRDFYDLDLREQLKILDWTFDDAGNVVDADW
jgi:hypothetical protein